MAQAASGRSFLARNFCKVDQSDCSEVEAAFKCLTKGRSGVQQLIKPFCCALVAAFCSCGGYVEPYLRYRASLSPAMVDEIQVFLREAVERRGFTYYGLSAKEADSPDNAPRDLFVAAFRDEVAYRQSRWFFTAADVGSLLSLHFYHEAGLSIPELDAFVLEIKQGLESRLGVQLCQQTRTGFCKDPREPDRRYKAGFEASMPLKAADTIRDVAKRWPRLGVQDVTSIAQRIAGHKDTLNVVVLYDAHPKEPWKKVLSVGSGADERLVFLDVFEGSGMPAADLRQFADELRGALEQKHGSPFCRTSLVSGLCEPNSR